MKKPYKLGLAFSLLLASICLDAQNVVISDNAGAIPDPSALLDVQSTNKGALFPRINGATMNLISNPAVGLLIFNTDTESFWYNTTTGWVNLSSVIAVDNTLAGNGTVANPLGLAQNGASNNDVLSWNGTNWGPSASPWLTNGDNIVYTPDRNVGIGLSQPQKLLHVKGDILAEETNPANGGFEMRDSNGFSRVYLNHIYDSTKTDFRFEVYVPNTNGVARVQFFRNTDAQVKRVEFYKGEGFGTERSAVIGIGDEDSFFQKSGGNLGIGTDQPAEKLDVDGNVHVNLNATIDGDLNCFGQALVNQKLRVNDDVTFNAGLQVGGNTNMDGTLVVQGVNNPSDNRYKKDLQPLQNALDKILQIKGLHYRWKVEDYPEKHFTKDLQLGVIAQDVAKVYPELVSIDKNGYLGIDYSRFSPILIEAIREQQQIIDTQQKQLDHLTRNMSALEALVNNALHSSTASAKESISSKKE